MSTIPKITVEKGKHHSMNVYLLKFPYQKEVVEKIKRIPGIRWSQSLKCWYGPPTGDFMDNLKQVEGIALHFPLNPEQLSEKISTTNTDTKNSIESSKEFRNAFLPVSTTIVDTISSGNKNFSENAQRDLNAWTDHLKSRNYAESSIRVYQNAMILFLQWIKDKNHKEVRKSDIEEYMKYLVIVKKVSRSYQNQHINAIKGFYKYIMSIYLSADMIERPRREYKLPRYLTREEVLKIIKAIPNFKHRTMTSLIYACGLRAGEAIRIQLRDIDPAARLLMIRQSKGNKDRTVPIPESILIMLNEYANLYKPTKYLFEGQKPNEMYSNRSLQQFFKLAVKKSGIRNQDASPHWLRHSYATHIMEMGTNLRDLQVLLGHKNLKTTEIYTHISSTNYLRIISPFDVLEENKDREKEDGANKKLYF